MTQASIAAGAIEARIGRTRIVSISTRGDAISARRPGGTWAGPDGQFTKELEHALVDRRIDVAVHSYKDLPITAASGVVVAAVLERADARDCLITADGSTLDELPFGARVGTGSPRRAAQLAAIRSDVVAVPMRGNVETRLGRVWSGELDAVLLAGAGLDRLGIAVPDEARLSFDVMLPAPAQGALALQVREDDEDLRDAVCGLDHWPSRIAVEAERALLGHIGGGCLAALGAFGVVEAEVLHLRAAYEDRHGSFVRTEVAGPANAADGIAAEAAERLDAAIAAT